MVVSHQSAATVKQRAAATNLPSVVVAPRRAVRQQRQMEVYLTQVVSTVVKRSHRRKQSHRRAERKGNIFLR